jgi:hypothetical protein
MKKFKSLNLNLVDNLSKEVIDCIVKAFGDNKAPEMKELSITFLGNVDKEVLLYKDLA